MSFEIGIILGSTRHSSNTSGLSNFLSRCLSSNYPLISSQIRRWSETVLAWDGMIILSPQYNWGYPAILKNSLDHLFHEWVKMPLSLLTFGGHGGSKCAEGLKVVCQGGMKMSLTDINLQISLPTEYIRGQDRVKGVEDWLNVYQEDLGLMIDQLISLMEKRKEE
ncbi:uncharacterized protein IL334_006964 [Kwoniella shivajii]|uniref:NADPH-dependent FMN reductase-like domain-containing protein n=1 Tax=Kwoniella shivajii TaxID=564305 RepID=A0ABZ1D858_9TREE|nr:hypothetical protein IL334_006964 [Kwoniella shivajii]